MGDEGIEAEIAELYAEPLIRQPAYDAVYPIIRAAGMPVQANHVVWCCVEAALDAMGISIGRSVDNETEKP